eukprot:GEMP01049789.1.p1 GENE.GEMP01049789.1~~GEMP01049789.1.p1  ORF type:complete len:318 (-),score=53.62 GEMP01049789.1:272-1225(-)
MQLMKQVQTSSGPQKKLVGIGSLFSALIIVETAIALYFMDYAAIVVTVHLSFHILAFVCAASAIQFVNRSKDPAYTFGPEVAYTVAAFANSMLLILIIVMLTVHVLHRQIRFANPSSIYICLARIGVDVLGLLVFSDETKLALSRTFNPTSVRVTSREELSCSVVIHLVANILVSGAFMFPNMLAPELLFVEPLAILVCGVCVLYLVLPILQSSMSILMLQAPSSQRATLGKCLRAVSFMDGVLEVPGWYFWPLPNDGGLQGQVALKVGQDYTDLASFERKVRDILTPAVLAEKDLTITVFRYSDAFSWLLVNPDEV